MMRPDELEDLANESLRETDEDFGRYPGYRAAQAKGTLCRGTFRSTGDARVLTRAPHLQPGAVTQVTVRFSNSATDPTRRDSAADVRGMSTAFHLPGGRQTDIIALAMSRFFVGTARQFLWWQRAMRRPLWGGFPWPRVWRAFIYYPLRGRLPLGHIGPQLAAPSRVPSYANCRYNSLHAFKFVDRVGGVQHARYSWIPGAGEKKLRRWQGRGRHPDYLRHELVERLASGPVSFALHLQLPRDGDPTGDASAKWKGAGHVEAGTLEITEMEPWPEMGTPPLVFAPTRLSDGIELPDGDDLLLLRKYVYARSVEHRTQAGNGASQPRGPGYGGPALPLEPGLITHSPDAEQAEPRTLRGGAPPTAAASTAKKVKLGNGFEICYDTHGRPDDRPLLLIMGFACPMTWWEPEFIQMFVDRGYHVIRFDNRDCGKSSRYLERYSFLAKLFPRRFAPYTVDAMAEDAAGLLQAVLGNRPAHVMGISLGGMIAQALAVKHPTRVLSLSSLCSTPDFRLWPPHRGPTFRALLRMGMLQLSTGKTLERHIRRSLPSWRLINGKHFPFEEERVRAHIVRAWEWSGGADPRANARQTLAVRAEADRTPDLRSLHKPVFVLHGSGDPLIRVAAGVDTWRAVPGWKKLVVVAGMGHYTPQQTWQLVVDGVDEVATEAEPLP